MVPDIKVFFCLSLAQTLPHEAKKWWDLAKEHIGQQQPLLDDHVRWDFVLKYHLMRSHEAIGAWEECFQATSELKTILKDDRRKTKLGLGSNFGHVPGLYAFAKSEVNDRLKKYAAKKGEQRAVVWRSDRFNLKAVHAYADVQDIDVATDSNQHDTEQPACQLPEGMSVQEHIISATRKYKSLKARFKQEEFPLSE